MVEEEQRGSSLCKGSREPGLRFPLGSWGASLGARSLGRMLPVLAQENLTLLVGPGVGEGMSEGRGPLGVQPALAFPSNPPSSFPS